MRALISIFSILFCTTGVFADDLSNLIKSGHYQLSGAAIDTAYVLNCRAGSWVGVHTQTQKKNAILKYDVGAGGSVSMGGFNGFSDILKLNVDNHGCKSIVGSRSDRRGFTEGSTLFLVNGMPAYCESPLRPSSFSSRQNPPIGSCKNGQTFTAHDYLFSYGYEVANGVMNWNPKPVQFQP